MKKFDCIVIGFGGVGSAALREAAKRGWSVLGIDRFGPAHDRGSSHGQTRIIRRAYFEHPSYVPLACRAFEMWEELNRRHRTSIEIKELITPTGLLQVGSADSKVIQGVMASAAQHDLRVASFTPREIERRLPLFKIQDHQIGLFEADAAILRVEHCVAAMINQALKHGAEIRSNCPVQSWRKKSGGNFLVDIGDETYESERLIVTCGAWSQSMLPELNLDLEILRKQQHWFQIDRVEQKLINDFPAFLMEQDDGSCFYGIPEIDYLGMKISEHSGGRPFSDPSQLDRELDAAVLERVTDFMKQCLNHSHHRMVHFSACMYTMTSDSHFIVDCHPAHENLSFAAGLSGHGFKFAPVIGKYLVDLLDGKRDVEFEFLRFGRW
jgi:sarcosine oxidase